MTTLCRALNVGKGRRDGVSVLFLPIPILYFSIQPIPIPIPILQKIPIFTDTDTDPPSLVFLSLLQGVRQFMMTCFPALYIASSSTTPVSIGSSSTFFAHVFFWSTWWTPFRCLKMYDFYMSGVPEGHIMSKCVPCTFSSDHPEKFFAHVLNIW